MMARTRPAWSTKSQKNSASITPASSTSWPCKRRLLDTETAHQRWATTQTRKKSRRQMGSFVRRKKLRNPSRSSNLSLSTKFYLTWRETSQCESALLSSMTSPSAWSPALRISTKSSSAADIAIKLTELLTPTGPISNFRSSLTLINYFQRFQRVLA